MQPLGIGSMRQWSVRYIWPKVGILPRSEPTGEARFWGCVGELDRRNIFAVNEVASVFGGMSGSHTIEYQRGLRPLR
jgi:hypothetical protein